MGIADNIKTFYITSDGNEYESTLDYNFGVKDTTTTTVIVTINGYNAAFFHEQLNNPYNFIKFDSNSDNPTPSNFLAQYNSASSVTIAKPSMITISGTNQNGSSYKNELTVTDAIKILNSNFKINLPDHEGTWTFQKSSGWTTT